MATQWRIRLSYDCMDAGGRICVEQRSRAIAGATSVVQHKTLMLYFEQSRFAFFENPHPSPLPNGEGTKPQFVPVLSIVEPSGELTIKVAQGRKPASQTCFQ